MYIHKSTCIIRKLEEWFLLFHHNTSSTLFCIVCDHAFIFTILLQSNEQKLLLPLLFYSYVFKTFLWTTGTILKGPQNVTAFQNDRVTFSCRIEAFTNINTKWDINGTLHYSITPDAFRTYNRSTNSTMNYTLGDYFFHLIARAEYNNSEIYCRYTPFDIPVWTYTCSDSATLMIQGIYVVCLLQVYTI